MVELGDPAPDAVVRFTSLNESNEHYELKQAYSGGTTVLYFFPACFTEVCVETTCELRDDFEIFSKLDAQIFGISTDMPFTQQQFIIRYQINYPLLSDYNKEAIRAFDIVDKSYLDYFYETSKRALFIIQDGNISFRWVTDDPYDKPPFEKVKQVLHS